MSENEPIASIRRALTVLQAAQAYPYSTFQGKSVAHAIEIMNYALGFEVKPHPNEIPAPERPERLSAQICDMMIYALDQESARLAKRCGVDLPIGKHVPMLVTEGGFTPSGTIHCSDGDGKYAVALPLRNIRIVGRAQEMLCGTCMHRDGER